MGEPALVLEEVVGEEAVRQTVRLTLIEGGAATAEATTAVAAAEAGTAVAAGEIAAGGAVAAAEAGGALAAGEVAAGGAAAGVGGAAVATAGIALVVIGLAALGYYLYKRSNSRSEESQQQVPSVPQLSVSCEAESDQSPEPVSEVVQNPKVDHAPKDCVAIGKEMEMLVNGGRRPSGHLEKGLKQRRGQLSPASPSFCGHLEKMLDLLIQLNRLKKKYENDPPCGPISENIKKWADYKLPEEFFNKCQNLDLKRKALEEL